MNILPKKLNFAGAGGAALGGGERASALVDGLGDGDCADSGGSLGGVPTFVLGLLLPAALPLSAVLTSLRCVALAPWSRSRGCAVKPTLTPEVGGAQGRGCKLPHGLLGLLKLLRHGARCIGTLNAGARALD